MARPGDPPVSPTLLCLIGEQVLIDSKGWFFYAGTLESVDRDWLTLTECDMHDHRESNSTREVYIMEIAKYGIRKNRNRVLVRLREVMSISRLAEITIY